MQLDCVMPRRIAQLLVGLLLYGIALAMMIRATLGVAPWDVLSQGITNHLPLGFGVVTIAVGALLLLIWIPLRVRPGVGTVLNVLLVGPAADLGLWLLPAPEVLWMRILLFAGGLLTLAIATGLYIGARFGPGPRDGLMTGLHQRTGWPIWAVRAGIELTVLAIGWVLGGNVGFGTVAFALLVGPLIGVTLPLLRVPEAERPVTPETGAIELIAETPRAS